MGVIGCILGFLIVIYLCYKDWSVYLATFAGACVVIACNTLPFIDSLVGDYVSGMFTAVKSFFFMILFGCLQSKIYTESGAAYTIADTVMNRLLKENMSNTGKNLIGMSVILVIGTIMTAELAIYEKFLNAKIPQYCGADSFALNGAFVGYGVDYTKLGTITADMVVQVLVDGKDPATLPVTTFDNGIAESCAALGYDLTAVKQAFDGKCSSVLETTTQQNFD